MLMDCDRALCFVPCILHVYYSQHDCGSPPPAHKQQQPSAELETLCSQFSSFQIAKSQIEGLKPKRHCMFSLRHAL